MLFSATYACPTCMLRFARRARCPECDGGRVLSLHTEEERADFRRLSRRAQEGADGGVQATLARIAEWAPVRSWFPVVFGVLLLVPACVVLAYAGVSNDGLELIAFAIAGALLLSFALVTQIARSVTEASDRGAKPRMLLVYTPSTPGAHATKLRGVVRRASVSLESPVAGKPCVAFGLRGDVDGAQLDDAEGGDFDLELESGESVMVSLEHALLVDDAATTPLIVPRTLYLDELLCDRGIGTGEGATCTPRVVEVLVREGDVVTIEAEVSGGAALSFGERAPSRVRVAAGTESHPLVVRVGNAPPSVTSADPVA